MAAVSHDQFLHLFDKHADRLDTWSENPLTDALEDVVTNFEKAKDAIKVQKVRETATVVLEAQQGAKDTAQVLRGLKRSYVASDAATDFGTLLKEGVEERQASSRWSAKDDEAYKFLEQAIADVHGEAQPATQREDDDDDDIVVNASQTRLAPNDKCPVSGRQLMEIQEPVQDIRGFVYEKAVIVHHIRKAPGPSSCIKCPEFGTSHTVCEKDLKPAKGVIKAQRRHKRNPAGKNQTQQGSHVMIDV